jgi:hypothetical protein
MLKVKDQDSALRFGGNEINSHPLTILTIFNVLIILSRYMLGYYLNIGHNKAFYICYG